MSWSTIQTRQAAMQRPLSLPAEAPDSTGDSAELPGLALGQVLAGLMQAPSGLMPAATPSGAAQQTPGAAPADEKAEVITTLGRHEDLIHGTIDQNKLKQMAADDSLPADFRQALQELESNPALFKELETAKNGKSDGKFSVKDVRAMQDQPDIKAYADAKSERYQTHYVPSDAAPGTAARPITANDAMRELFRGSESLPKKFNLEDLRKIADGSADTRNATPQLMAAAKYFVDHPDDWKKLTGKNSDQKVGRDAFCDIAGRKVQLSPEESQTIQTLADNKTIFFGNGKLTKDKLQAIAQDPSNSDEVRRAATQLGSNESMLFSMLDNARYGAGGDALHKANDKKISSEDLDAFIKKGSGQVTQDSGLDTGYQVNGFDKPSTSPIAPVASADGSPLSAADADAQMDMQLGLESPPIPKKEKGGALLKALDIIGQIASYAIDLIPGIGTAVGMGSLLARIGIRGIEGAAAQGAKQGLKEVGNQVLKATEDKVQDQVLNQLLSPSQGNSTGTSQRANS